MSWQGQMSTMIRHIIGDVDHTNYKYSPSRIETAILVSAQLVTFDVDLPNAYTINVEQCRLTPDPTIPETLDKAFINLTVLKASCIILGSEIKTEAGNAIAIKDGPSSIDLRGVSATLSTLYKDICSKYDKLLLDYKAGGTLAGQAVLGPYSPGSDFVSRNYSFYDQRAGGYFNY